MNQHLRGILVLVVVVLAWGTTFPAMKALTADFTPVAIILVRFVLVVPLLGLMGGRLPERRIVAALVLAVAGLVALCWDGGAWARGDTLALLAALTFGAYTKLMEVRSRAARRLPSVTASQIATVAACARRAPPPTRPP